MRALLWGALGVALGAVVTAVVIVGETQAASAAGGAVNGLGSNAIILVAPQWSTAVAAATALIVAALVMGALELTRRRGNRAFWIGWLIPIAAVLIAGTAASGDALDAQRRTPVVDLFAAGAHSPLLLVVVLVAATAALLLRSQSEVPSLNDT